MTTNQLLFCLTLRPFIEAMKKNQRFMFAILAKLNNRGRIGTIEEMTQIGEEINTPDSYTSDSGLNQTNMLSF
jgi:hypothetical protein